MKVRLVLAIVFAVGLLAGDASFAGGEEKIGTIQSLSEVTLLVNDAYYEALSQHIRKARHEIFVGAYIFKTSPRSGAPNKIMEQLMLAARRGVRVSVLLEKSRQRDSLNSLNQETAKVLAQAGVAVCFDSPSKTTHSKLVIIDGRYILIGSHNLTPAALKYNNEVSVLIDSPKMALAAKRYWQDAYGQHLGGR